MRKLYMLVGLLVVYQYGLDRLRDSRPRTRC